LRNFWDLANGEKRLPTLGLGLAIVRWQYTPSTGRRRRWDAPAFAVFDDLGELAEVHRLYKVGIEAIRQRPLPILDLPIAGNGNQVDAVAQGRANVRCHIVSV
jgi:hypothetical protein